MGLIANQMLIEAIYKIKEAVKENREQKKEQIAKTDISEKHDEQEEEI